LLADDDMPRSATAAVWGGLIERSTIQPLNAVLDPGCMKAPFSNFDWNDFLIETSFLFT